MGEGRARESRRGGSKKKDLTENKQTRPEQKRKARARTLPKHLRAVLDGSEEEHADVSPPEAFGAGAAINAEEEPFADALASASSWDVAVRYQELKRRLVRRGGDPRVIRRLSADAILERAREVLGSVVHPTEARVASLRELPGNAEQPDFDFDESLECSPLALAGLSPLTEDDIWMTYTVHRRQGVVLTVDTSLSMTGEKLALTAVAIAVVLLQFPEDPVGIVAFENEAKVIKRPEERISIHQLVERFLDVPAQGYTHLEDGMKAALSVMRAASAAGQGRPASTVLLTDGKYTAGRDPAYLASRFPHLVVLKMGREKASLGLCRELAQKGSGALREVGELESLPLIMYGVVKDLLRGRSLA